MSKPEFSLIINNYNYGGFLDQCIRSCLDQPYLSKEVIVVDDGSTDNSRSVILSFGDRIKSHFKKNGGQASAFNAGLQIADGSWIWFLDSDDYLLPHALQLVADAIRDKKPALLYGQPLWVNAEGKPLPPRKQRHEPVRRGHLWPHLLHEGSARFPPTSCLIFQRAELEKIMPISERHFSSGCDDYLRRRILFHGTGWGLEESITAYRQHAGNASRLARHNWNSIKRTWLRQSLTYHYVRMEALKLKQSCPASRRKLEMAHALIYLGICRERERHQNQAWADLRESFKNDHSVSVFKKSTYLLLGYMVLILPAPWGRTLILLLERFKAFRINWPRLTPSIL